MADALDTEVNDLAQKAQDLQKDTTGVIWKVVGGVVVALGLWWLKYQLSKKNAELAEAKTELELTKLKARQDTIAAATEAMAEKRAELEKVAQASFERVLYEEKLIKEASDAHELRMKKVEAIAANDWDALNKLSGVP